LCKKGIIKKSHKNHDIIKEKSNIPPPRGDLLIKRLIGDIKGSVNITIIVAIKVRCSCDIQDITILIIKAQNNISLNQPTAVATATFI